MSGNAHWDQMQPKIQAPKLALVPKQSAQVATRKTATVIECIIRIASGTARTFAAASGFSANESEAWKFETFEQAQEYSYHLLARHDVIDVAFLVRNLRA